MKTSVENYNFDLPENLIAQYPSDKRGESNLLILNKSTGIIEQKKFADIVDLITENDFLVINNTKVLKARLFGKKTTGGKVEILLIEDIGNNKFKALTNGKVKIGTEIIIDKYMVKIIDFSNEEGQRIIEFSDINPYELMEKSGHLPLPPYIKREDSKEDELRYQTVYAKNQGSVAAPTAGLHFTKEIIDKIKEKGIEIIEITLNVGIGTFRPVKADFIQEHKMHFEHYSISEESADRINKLKSEGKKLISVGTTTTRALESASDRNGKIIKTGNQSTNIFIYPPYEFKIVDKLITNFHLPKSTLLMMISAFAGKDKVEKAYDYAIKNNFKFFSYGDAMFIK
jgi:S-adenosylmethionine:tRNA ribosyltransferase-isomerase